MRILGEFLVGTIFGSGISFAVVSFLGGVKMAFAHMPGILIGGCVISVVLLVVDVWLSRTEEVVGD